MATEEAFIPKGDLIPLKELTDYTDNGEVAITRGDVERAIATSVEELQKFLEARQKKK
ncbi:hypothetical protein [Chroococcidiopsis sp.]|uniref:hypothetical protein n=1 Tax=Chroococcidiopsis sp. TaxID=3088168 RepID=UPI003F2E8DB9